MELVTQVQILEKTVCISLYTNALTKAQILLFSSPPSRYDSLVYLAYAMATSLREEKL